MSLEPTTSSFLDSVLTCDLSASSEPSNLQPLLEEAIKKYKEQVGTSLIENQIAMQLRTCNDAESIAKLLEEQAQAFHEFLGHEHHPKMMSSIRHVVHVLHTTFTGPFNSLSGGAIQVGHGIGSVVHLNPLMVPVFLVPSASTIVIPTWKVTIFCNQYTPRHMYLPQLVSQCYFDI
jgi:hypothetical protein